MEQQGEKAKIRIILPAFYRRLIILFLIVSCILALGLWYFIFGSVRITITPAYQKVNTEAIITVKGVLFHSPLESDQSIKGSFYEYRFQKDFEIQTTGKKIVSDETVGRVRIVNNYSRDQILVATTRLLAPDGTLLRTSSDVVVPSGGSVVVSVYPDKPESFTRLEPTRFLIPGLWEGLQDKIYAESTMVLQAGERTVPFVSQDDLDNIEERISDQLDALIFQKLENDLLADESLFSKLIKKDIENIHTDAQVGDERESFRVNVSVNAVVIVFDESRLFAILKRRFNEELPTGKRLEALLPESIVYFIESYNPDEPSASIRVYAEGRAVLNRKNEIFSVDLLAGMSEEEVLEYLQQFPEIQHVEVKFSPSWLRRVPRSSEKIEVVIK